MSMLHSVPRPEWRAFFDRVSGALLGITYDARDDALDVALDRATHSIRRPREITVEESPAGLVSVAVIDEDGAQQIVRLKDPLKLPPSSPAPG